MHHVAVAPPASSRVLKQAPLLSLEHIPATVGGSVCRVDKGAVLLRGVEVHAQRNVVHDVRVLQVAYAADEKSRRHSQAVEPPDVVAGVVAGHAE